MTSLAIIISSVIPLIIIGMLLVWSRRRDYYLRTLILGATFAHEILLVVFPTIYSTITYFELENSMASAVTAEDLLQVMVGESLFILMFAIGLIVMQPQSKQKYIISPNLPGTQRSLKHEQLIVNILILAGCLVYIPKVIVQLFNVEIDILDKISFYLTGIFWYMPLVICAFLVTKRGEIRNKPVRTFFTLIPLASVFVIGITSGIRGRIIWVISLIFLAGLFNRQKKFVVISVVGLILLVPVFSVLGNSATRSSLASTTSTSEILTIVYEAGRSNINNFDEFATALFASFAWRAQAVRNSAVLYQDYDLGGGGFMTYAGALFAFIPRDIWAEKPMLGSLNHTEFESAIYKVMLSGYDEPGTMGPILASAHAYWEGGWVWLVIAGLITGIFWNLVFRYCRRLPDLIAAVVTFTFAAALLIDGLLTMLMPLYSFIIRCWLSVLPLLFVSVLISIVLKQLRYKKNVK